MKNCERIRPLLSSFAEGEADPVEAFHVARHLAGCTACKIVLARERRLHEALEGLGDSVSVDEEFSALVMAALPAGPPPAASRPRRRGLRLAGFLALATAGSAMAFRALGFGPDLAPVRFASRIDFDGASGLLDGLGRAAGAAAAFVARIATGLPGPSRAAGGEIGVNLVAVLAAAALLAAGSLLALGTWAASRTPRRRRETLPPGAGPRSGGTH